MTSLSFPKIRPTVYTYFVDISAVDDIHDAWLYPQIARASSPSQRPAFRRDDVFAASRSPIIQPAPDPVITDPE